MKIDIAICTWNRADQLLTTLESIGRANLPDGVEARIIVVNNNSTDHTVACVQAFEKRLGDDETVSPNLSVALVDEPRQGHTHSRNRAISVAAGDLILWTDDDVQIDSNWLASYVNAALNSSEVFWGGKIIPKFVDPKPQWIAENWDSLKGCFAERDLGDKRIQLTTDKLPYGANFAIRTEVQKQFQFNVELGRYRDSALGEDEIEMFRRLLGAGYEGSWIPESSLFHIIDPDRATEAYVHNYFVGQGKALVKKGVPWSTSQSRLGWQRIYEFAAYRFKRQWAASPAWVAHLIRSGLAEGQHRMLKTAKR